MKINMRALRITATLAAIAGLTAGLGNACSQMQSGGANSALATSTGTCTAGASVPAFVAVSGLPTPSMLYGTNGTNSTVVQSYLACLGMTTADLSNGTLLDIASRSPNFAPTSYIGNVSSATLMAMAQIAYDIAGDLVTKESAEPAANRNFSPLVDYTGTTTIPTSAIDDVLARVANSCAGRAPYAGETSATEQAIAALNAAPSYDVIGIIGSFLASPGGWMQK